MKLMIVILLTIGARVMILGKTIMTIIRIMNKMMIRTMSTAMKITRMTNLIWDPFMNDDLGDIIILINPTTSFVQIGFKLSLSVVISVSDIAFSFDLCSTGSFRKTNTEHFGYGHDISLSK